MNLANYVENQCKMYIIFGRIRIEGLFFSVPLESKAKMFVLYP